VLLRLVREQVSAPQLPGPPQQLRQATLPVPGSGRSETGQLPLLDPHRVGREVQHAHKMCPYAIASGIGQDIGKTESLDLPIGDKGHDPVTNKPGRIGRNRPPVDNDDATVMGVLEDCPGNRDRMNEASTRIYVLERLLERIAVGGSAAAGGASASTAMVSRTRTSFLIEPPSPLWHPPPGITSLGGKISERESRRKPWASSTRSTGPRRVRAASGTAGSRRAPAVTAGIRELQVRRHAPLRPRTAKTPGDEFESHPTTAVPPLAAYPPGRWSPRTGLHLPPSWCDGGGIGAALSSPAVPQTCPKQQSTAVTKGQQRSPAEGADLRHRRTASSTTVLPKLAVLFVGAMVGTGLSGG